MSESRVTLIFVIFSLLLLTGCLSLQPTQTQPVATYTLNTLNANRIAAKKTSQVLLVSNTQAASGYETSRMLYMTKAHQLNNFTKNRWVAPPASLLTPLFVQSLQNTHHYRAVVSPPYVGNVDLRLDTQLLTLQQEFFAKQSVIHLKLQATLINTHSLATVATKQFEVFRPALENTPYGGVMAANEAVAEVLTDVAKFSVGK